MPNHFAGVQAGGIYVDENARTFLQERFTWVNTLTSNQQSQFINDGVEDFIANAKNHFDDADSEVVLKVGSLKDDFEEIEVDSGDMIITRWVLPGNQFSSIFLIFF